MTEPVRIRMIDATKDAEAVLQIYAHYIENTAITFETSVPGIAEFEQRIRSIGSRFPFLVCTLNGTIVGYAYADAQRERAAYQWNAELSVYVKKRMDRSRIRSCLVWCDVGHPEAAEYSKRL